MSVIDFKTAAAKLSGAAARARQAAVERETIAECRELVPLMPVEPPHGHMTPTRHPAEFIAQLLAARGRAPQLRERRRVEPAEAVAAYRAAADLTDVIWK
ncbi:MAG: hypothetical protein ACRECC_11600 [Pseudolabrys sp.]|jgi:hypothetical protein